MIPPHLPQSLRSKAEFSSAWLRGVLGNRLEVWQWPGQVPFDYHGRIMLRVKAGARGTSHDYPHRQACRIWARDPDKWMGNETAPDELATLQGEALILAPQGFQLFAWERGPEDLGVSLRMREALLRAKQYTGLEAIAALKRNASYNSYEDIRELLDLWPNAVVEFSCYARNLGNRQLRNTIIWEVRDGY